MTAKDLRRLIDLIESQADLTAAEEQQLYAAMNTLAEFSSSHTQSDRLDRAYDLCMRLLPEAQYTGPMYRGFDIDPDTLDRADLSDQIRDRMQSYSRQVLSWSRDPQIAKEFAAENGVGVVIEQRSTGIDTDRLYYEPTDFSVDGGFSGEQEVFARRDPSATILGFVAGDPDEFWPADHVDQFLRHLRSQQD